MVIPLNLEQITERADKIFVGTCQDIDEAIDENGLRATYLTYSVEETIKGEPRSLEQIKVFGTGDYKIGKREILFLYKESQLGFSSPVGAGQGRFEILSEGSGALVQSVFYRNLNQGISQNASSDLQSLNQSKAVPLGTFLKKVYHFSGGKS